MPVELLETGVKPLAVGTGGAVLPLGVGLIHLLVRRADQRDEFAQGPEMRFAALDLLVHNDPVEPFLGGLAHQLFGQGDVLLGGEAEIADDAFDFGFRCFDALGDLDLLLAGQQRDLAHLPQIHADWVVQDIEPRLLVFLFLFGLLDAVHFGLVNNFNLQAAQLERKSRPVPLAR